MAREGFEGSGVCAFGTLCATNRLLARSLASRPQHSSDPFRHSRHAWTPALGVSDLVTVFESPDVALLAMAKAALERAGVRYVTQNEFTQDLFGLGRMGTGYNLITGPTRIRVTSENAERARELLAELDD